MSILSSLFASGEKRDWLSDDDWMWANSVTASGANVNQNSAMQLSAVWACVRLLTDAIATLPMDIVVSMGRDMKFTLGSDERPFWLTEPDPADPTTTATQHFAQVTTSLLLDGNFFVLADPDVYAAQALVVMDPRRIDVRSSGRTPVYDIRNDKGQVIASLGPDRMLHGMWMRQPGSLRGISPVEAARQGIGLGLTAEEFGARFFGQGTTLSYGVEVPGPMTDQQREELRANLKQRLAGTKNAFSVSVLTSGAKFVPGLGLTNDQAQFIELRKFQVEDIARWFGVPPHMLGSQEPGASSYSSVAERGREFARYAVLPLARRIEDPYQRLVEVPARLLTSRLPVSASFRFNLDGFERADIKTRYESYSAGIMAGVLKPNEARALEDLAPSEGGDKLYMQQQMVPLGMPPAPPPAPPSPPADDSEDNDEDDAEAADRALFRSAVAASLAPAPAPIFNLHVPPSEVRIEQPAPIVNVTTPEVRVETPAPVVNVETPAPVVNVEAPNVTVAPPEVRVDAPVTVKTPDSIRITEMPARQTTRRVTKRDTKGSIAETVDVEVDA